MGLVVPAVLPASKSDLEEKLALFAKLPGVSRVQIDVVDGKFASPASWPYTKPAELRAMRASGMMLPHLDRIEYEIDLMSLDAERDAAPWLAEGASRLTLHAESATDLPRFLALARGAYGECVTFGLAQNIATDLALLEPCLPMVAYVQFMGIARIGRQGQLFDRRVLKKIQAFRARHPDVSVQVDGGVTLENAEQLVGLGVANLIIGSGLLKASDPAATLAEFEALQTPFGV